MQSPSTSTCMMDAFRCRLCFKSSDQDLLPLFPPGDECFANDLLSQIYDCLTIHVSFLEDFCSVICSGCRAQIKSFYNFKKQCQSNDDYLREKRSREMNGMEPERKSQDSRSESEMEAHEGKVKESQPEELVRQAESIFFPKRDMAAGSPSAGKCVQKVDVGVQICGTTSNESFRGFADEVFARRSPRIFIKNSVTEAYDMIKASSDLNDEMQDCHVPLEKLEIELDIPDYQPRVDEMKPRTAPKRKYRKAIRTVPAKDNVQSPRSLRQKVVLFFDGFEYRTPRTCHDGTMQWVCCKISCPATLEQKADGKLKLNAKHRQHTPQVVRDTVVLDRKSRKWVALMVTYNNHKRKVICDDAFRYRFSHKQSNGQMIWACDAQQTGCKALLRVVGDFRAVSRVFQHNHAETIMVRRRKVARKQQ